ncbi:alpha-L-fucosidase [Occultella glacieicola]|uniref:alpha-L-fucosidase n=1 Tax=Occultella glacieicola TaxID=2518684 RepID=A0ABY2E2C8_9MICO|nr:alpha-L-fucosidase [Occultella glacieicola]TDE91662.1 alpha-L-fucosidase [Occultella glacieicola]
MTRSDTPTPVPTPAQLRWQEAGLGVFWHFGINTFNDREWSDGTLEAATFDPADLDVDQWVRTAVEAGARYAVLTAKHHDGFCLWPTATTTYSVASSPWRDGNGDLVAEVAAACRRRGLALGLYLSPWDRNAACYDDPAAYDDFYLAQLRELCSNYGDLFELWFDGAGSAGRSYDWPRIGDLIDELQPGAMVFNMGRPTIRWVGNEDGLATDPVTYVVESTHADNYTEGTDTLTEPAYLPPECDVSIRPGWFHHDTESPKSVDHLLAIAYRSIGLGAGLLLNLPPDARGRIPDEDVARVCAWRAEWDRRFDDPVPATLTGSGDTVRARFERPVRLDHLLLREDLSGGQHVRGHEVRTPDGVVLAAAGTVGIRRVHVFEPVRVHELLIRVDADGAASATGHLTAVVGYDTAGAVVPDLPADYRAPTTPPPN